MRKLYWYFTTYLKKHGWIFIVSLILAIVFFWITIPFIANKISIGSERQTRKSH
jgi:multisubunit Na+/H+ antiporter MnhG subunit